MTLPLDAPFVWFGGKRRVAGIVWQRFGAVANYVEPFYGSGAVLLGRPGVDLDDLPLETVNDLDGFVANAWRAIALRPEETAEWADQPVMECDLHARHVWLRERRADLTARLCADPDYCDTQIAGWWLWGMACWIGGGWCGPSGSGPWIVETDAEGVRRFVLGDASQGVKRQRVHLGDRGQGVCRQLPLPGWFAALAARLRRVRVCCGDWSRVMGPSVTFKHGLTAVFLDPPYSAEAGRDMGCYALDSGDVAHAVRDWALANGDNPLLRIALCGYEGEHEMPDDWECVAWKAGGGYGAGKGGSGDANKHRERIWFSPACLRPGRDAGQLSMFQEAAP